MVSTSNMLYFPTIRGVYAISFVPVSLGLFIIALHEIQYYFHRFSELAKLLVQKARGKENGYYWIKDSKEPASYDDISVFAIPLYNKNEY